MCCTLDLPFHGTKSEVPHCLILAQALLHLSVSRVTGTKVTPHYVCQAVCACVCDMCVCIHMHNVLYVFEINFSISFRADFMEIFRTGSPGPACTLMVHVSVNVSVNVLPHCRTRVC